MMLAYGSELVVSGHRSAMHEIWRPPGPKGQRSDMWFKLQRASDESTTTWHVAWHATPLNQGQIRISENLRAAKSSEHRRSRMTLGPGVEFEPSIAHQGGPASTAPFAF